MTSLSNIEWGDLPQHQLTVRYTNCALFSTASSLKPTVLNRLLQLFQATQVTQANTNYAPAITHHNAAVHWATIINAFMDGLTQVKLTSTEY